MKKLIIAFLCIMSVLPLAAQNVAFKATASSTTVAAGDRFQVTFTLENAQGGNFRAPGFKGFTVLGGPSTSQHTSYVNGRMSSSVSYTYAVQADNKGTYTIGAASIDVDGKRYKSNPLTITVLEESERSKIERKQERDMNQQAMDLISDNIYIRLHINKSKVYQGEEIVAIYKLYMNPNLSIADYSPPRMPTFNGFWAQDFDIDQIKFTTEYIDGKPFNVGVLKHVVLIPQRSGNLTVDPMEMDFVVRLNVQSNQRRSRDPFDRFFSDPFFNRNYKDFKYTAKSRKSSIDVLPLPETSLPSFSGAVGNLKMEVSLNKTKTKTNDPVTLKIKLSGKGNLKLIEPFELPLPQDIESFDPKVIDNLDVTRNGITGHKTFEYLLIPRHAGKYKIDPIEFTYFDLTKKEYVTLSSDAYELEVEKGTGAESYVSGAVSGVKKENIEYIGKDIRFIKTELSSISSRGSSFFLSYLYLLLLLCPPLGFFFVFFFRRKQREMYENVALMRNKKATKAARKRLSVAKSHLKDNKTDVFYEEVNRALWGYLSDKLSIPHSDLTKDKAREELLKLSVREDVIEHLLSTIDHCEFARFAPSAAATDMQKDYEDAVNVITGLEGSLK